MPFDPKTGDFIDLETASAFTATYRENYSEEPKAHAIGKDRISQIINQTGCVGIRMYRGIDEDENQCVVIVGVDSAGRDMTQGLIAERTQACPPNCDDQSSLNG